MRGQGRRGQALVEFSLIVIPLLLLIFGSFDIFRIVEAQNTVADAARQGARQAVANASPANDPFGASSGSCSGTTATQYAGGAGCLTDARIVEAVAAALSPFNKTVLLYSNTSPSACATLANDNAKLPIGQSMVCIYPGESGTASAYASCAAAESALGRDVLPGDLGTRYEEWSNPKFQGCYLVDVTVIYKYDSLTPLLGPFAPSFIKLASTTTMLAEY